MIRVSYTLGRVLHALTNSETLLGNVVLLVLGVAAVLVWWL